MKISVPAGVLTIAALSAVWSGRVLAFQAHRVSVSGPRPASPASPPSVAPAKPSQSAQATSSDHIYDHLDCENWEHDEKTQKGSCDNFKYFDPDSKTTVTGPHATYDDNKKILNTAGDLVLDDEKHHVTAAKADVYYGPKKLAVLDGNVKIDLKAPQDPDPAQAAAPPPPAAGQQPPTGAQGNAAQGPSYDVKSERGRGGTITCDHVEDYYKKKFVVLQGHLVFTQQYKKTDHMVTRTMVAEHGEYDGKTEKLHLFAPVHGTDTDGQTIDFEKDAYVGTHEGEETVASKGKVHIVTLHDDHNKDEDDDGATDTKAALKGDDSPPPDKGKQIQH